jgi:hypothetical protein
VSLLICQVARMISQSMPNLAGVPSRHSIAEDVTGSAEALHARVWSSDTKSSLSYYLALGTPQRHPVAGPDGLAQPQARRVRCRQSQQQEANFTK